MPLPRLASWVSGSTPSRLMLTRLMLDLAIFSTIRGDSKIPLVASATLIPLQEAYSASRNMSGRRRGSPPLSMIIGDSGATSSMKWRASSVLSSSSSGSSVAEARQYSQRRLQAAVTSQAIISIQSRPFL